jgi:hypothetical protein
VGYFFVSPFLIEWDFKRRVRKLVLEVTQGKGADHLKNCTLLLSSEGIDAKNAAGESKHPWSSIEKIETLKNYAYFFKGPASAIIVPQRAFNNHAAWDAFLTTAHHYHKNAQN